MNNQIDNEQDRLAKATFAAVPLTARTLVLHNCGSQLVWMPCALRISRRESGEASGNTKQESTSVVFTVQVWSDLPVCLCRSSLGSSVRRSTADFTRFAQWQDIWICTLVSLWGLDVSLPPSLPPPDDLLLLLYFRVTTGYGNIWSVHSSHSLGAAGGGEAPSLPPHPSLPPSLIYRRMQRVVERGHTHTHTDTGQRLCLYTQAFTWYRCALSALSALSTHSTDQRAVSVIKIWTQASLQTLTQGGGERIYYRVQT